MHKKRTKIVCTIGPASSSEDTLREMIAAGMNVARLNFSHGTYDEHAAFMATLRGLAKETDEPIAILQDLQGPKIRVGVLPEAGVELPTGSTVTFTTGEASVPERLPVTYDKLHEDVKPGERLLLDDGLLSATVVEVRDRDIVCKMVDGGTLFSHKGMNFPQTTLGVSAITEKDSADVRFGVQQHVDWVALSFVRTAKEIYDLRFLIKKYEEELGIAPVTPIRIVAKIEKHEAVRNIDAIIEAVDGIMVARGDLGIEMPAEDVPLIQKRLIDACRAAGKPVIVATQMLDSMIRNARPTRAEVSDVANAVIDHTDAVMLSGETANGKHPVETVATMARIIEETEASSYDDVPVPPVTHRLASTEDAVAQMANMLARGIKAKLILVATLSGDTARIVSRYRPELPIYAATDIERARSQMNLSWGVIPFILPRCRTVEELVERSVGFLKEGKRVKTGDKIILVAGEPVGVSGGVNLVEIREIH